MGSLRLLIPMETFCSYCFDAGSAAAPEKYGHHALVCRHKYGYTVLVTLLRCIVNFTAYPIQELCGPFPQKQGLGLKGLGWGFLTLTERALKE